MAFSITGKGDALSYVGFNTLSSSHGRRARLNITALGTVGSCRCKHIFVPFLVFEGQNPDNGRIRSFRKVHVLLPAPNIWYCRAHRPSGYRGSDSFHGSSASFHGSWKLRLPWKLRRTSMYFHELPGNYCSNILRLRLTSVTTPTAPIPNLNPNPRTTRNGGSSHVTGGAS